MRSIVAAAAVALVLGACAEGPGAGPRPEGRVPEAEACIEIAVFKGIEATLDAPLGDREVVDGAA